MAGPHRSKPSKPNQGIGTASSKVNPSGQRKLRKPYGPNAEPTAARAAHFGKDFISKPAARKQGRSSGGK